MIDTTPARYMPDPAYSAMVARLAEAHEAGDPLSHIREVVGEYAGIWPEDVLADPEAETSIEERFAATLLDFGDLVAADPHYHDPEARLDLVMTIIERASSLSPAARNEVASAIRNYFAAQQAAAEQEHRSE